MNYQRDVRAVGSYILDRVPLASRCGRSGRIAAQTLGSDKKDRDSAAGPVY
ncbi:hypothetical protein [Roseibium alexandrii]|uniref:hypothetical protein n=1 Tax=Roseibium alexandrii TaxID=388408 RepID=UPI0039F0DC37